ncbi:MAG: DUF692 domain-containing protein [Methylococcaceae bacterium]|nr:DUF692 domain-containing protein [Methylococcaceae bacterium]
MIRPIGRLGVGFTWSPGLNKVTNKLANIIDFLEISPDIICRELLINEHITLDFSPELLALALDATAKRPVVLHGLGLSIGSASGWNEQYLNILDTFLSLRDVPWHSEHLGFLCTKRPNNQLTTVGVPLPLPFTKEVIDMLAIRIKILQDRFFIPFLLENTSYYLPSLPSEPGWDEIVFLNELTSRTNCGLLLDLYNLYCNFINQGIDPFKNIGRLNLEHVIEIHIAGGATHDGFLLDVHSDIVPEPVWQLLEYVVPRAPNLRGIVYELLDEGLYVVGLDNIHDQLMRIRNIYDNCNFSN